MNTLFIDTSDRTMTIIGLTIKDKKELLKQKMDYRKSQIVLVLIDKILKKYKLEMKDVHAIEVITGPGSFTGIRVGIAVANALRFTYNIPINGKKALAKPRYI